MSPEQWLETPKKEVTNQRFKFFVDQNIVCTEKKIFKSNMPISRTAAIIKEHYIIYAHLKTEFGKIIVIKKR